MVVAVKCLSGTTTNASRKVFLQEMEIMKILSIIPNRHVVALLGQVTQGDPFLLLTEYMRNGSLRDYLYDARKGANDRISLSLDQLCVINLGVARGMAHLVNKRVLHRYVSDWHIVPEAH
jgi:serine/threonine protein kinase